MTKISIPKIAGLATIGMFVLFSIGFANQLLQENSVEEQVQDAIPQAEATSACFKIDGGSDNKFLGNTCIGTDNFAEITGNSERNYFEDNQHLKP